MSTLCDIEFITQDDSSTTYSFDRVSTCTIDTIELIACYTYDSEYSNLADLCDIEKVHVVEGALG